MSVIIFPAQNNRTLSDMIEEFIFDLHRRKYSKHTIRSYSATLKLLNTQEEINSSSLKEILNNPAWDKNTVAARQAGINAFFKWTYEEGYIDSNPAEKLGQIKNKQSLPRPIPNDDLTLILMAARKKMPLSVRTLFNLLPALALRVGEALSLDVNDITWNKGQEAIIVKHGKGDRERIIPFTWDMSCTPLLKRLCVQQKAGALFTTGRGTRSNYDWAYYWWEKTLEAANISGYTIHQLRHTAITEKIRNGMSMVAAKRLAGHRRIQSTEIYTQVNENDLRKELEKTEKTSR